MNSKAIISSSSSSQQQQQQKDTEPTKNQNNNNTQLLLQMFLHAQNIRKFPAFATTKHDHDVAYTPTSTALIHLIGGTERIRKMTHIFYQKFYNDRHLRQFLGNLQVPIETHANRLALYIVEQLAGEQVWERNMRSRPRHEIRLANGQSYQVTSRAGAHFCAWHSVARPANMVGRRFKLDDCRIWMRLMFWAAREVGFVPPRVSSNNNKSKDDGDDDVKPKNHPPPRRFSPCTVPKLIVPGHELDTIHDHDFFSTTNPDEIFFVVFQNFISYFIAIYEQTARPFTRHEALWSADPRNIDEYLKSANNNSEETSLPYMRDVINVPYAIAIQTVARENIITDQDLFSVTVEAD